MAQESKPIEQPVITEPTVQVVEEKKTEKKRSFVSDKDAPAPAGAKAVPSGEAKIPPPEVTLMLIYNQTKIQNELLTELVNLIKNGPPVPSKPAPSTKPVEVTTTKPTEVKPTTPAQVIAEAVKTSAIPMTPTLQKIQDSIQSNALAELIFVDETATDTNYYIIRPRQFLGSENFAKVAGMIRGLGGEYISQGRTSHFKVKKD